jgi:branched-chain amino acid transport system ATP-binding protein
VNVSNDLAIDGVVVGYGRAAAVLGGVGFPAPAGSVTTIIGPNGAGKSTLLKAVAGVLPLRSGDITLDGASIAALTVGDRVRRGISLCGQGRVNFAALTVEENLRLAAYTAPRREVRQRLQAVRAQDPTTNERWHDRVSNLSGGQQQAVEISMALMTAPRVLLLDEPSLGLAPSARRTVFRRIRAIADDGVCVLVVEQNVKAAAEVSDTIVVLDQGQVVLIGPPNSVLTAEALRHVYVGGYDRKGAFPSARERDLAHDQTSESTGDKTNAH